jgi:hypothetical protein
MEAMRWTANLRFDAADADIFAGNAPIRKASQTAIQLIGRYSAHRRSRSTGTRLDGMVRRAEQGGLNHGARSGAPMDRPQTAWWSATIELIVARNRWFESVSLHRRASELSVPDS